MVVSILVAAGVLHVVAVMVAGLFVIAQNFLPEPPSLEVKSDVKFPAKVRKHRIEMRQLERAQPKVSAHELLKSVHAAPLTLPELPALPQLSSTLVADLGAEFAGEADETIRGGWVAHGESSFFGVRTEAQRILILYDISKTVVNSAARTGIPMEKIRQESCRLIERLSIQCRFGLVQFARNYALLSKVLLPVTDGNRRRAKAWLNRWFATTGMMPLSTPNLVTGSPGFLKILTHAFHLKPQVMYILSDGNFYRHSGLIPYSEIQSVLRSLQQAHSPSVIIHFFAIGMKAERFREMRKILSAYGGSIRKL